MRRVLKPGGRVAFATWPPEHFVGRFFALVGRVLTAATSRRRRRRRSGATPQSSPSVWPLASNAPFFARGTMHFPALSLAHFRVFMEHSVGPMQKLVEGLAGDPAEARRGSGRIRRPGQPYYADNLVHQDYLLTRARAR